MSGQGRAAVGKKEEDCSCYAESRTRDACPPRGLSHPLRYYEFTQEEIKALEECDKESFYQRCLPFSTMFATVTYAAIRYGWMRRSPHWGAVPKLAAAAFVGHLCGRLAYVPHCDAKLRELPSASYLGNVMRKHHNNNYPPPPPPPPPPGTKPAPVPAPPTIPKRECSRH